MFDKFKRHPQPKQTKPLQVTEESEKMKLKTEPKKSQNPKEVENTQIIDESQETIKKESILEEKPDINYSSTYPNKEIESEFMAIKEYSSFSELSERINKEISQTKSKLGEYLFQIDKKKVLAEKSQKILNLVSKMTGKQQSKENQGELLINGLQVVLDATPRHELEVLESVVKSKQDHL
ncbi:hypothetical protein JJE00_04865, partial [Candidatus Bathyarchaeota archaeon]|nr:hypothetical protein [Candidatus Bathyarchaeota archaeon]